jgi:hypothetical protein
MPAAETRHNSALRTRRAHYGLGAWGFRLAFDEGFLDEYLGGDIGEFAPLPRLHLFAHGLEVALHSVDMQSISENDVECFAGTGVHAPRTMFPDSSPMSVFQKPASVEPGSPRTFRVAASLDRKRLGADFWGGAQMSIRGVFDEEARRKPLAFAAGAGYAAGYGI